MEINGKKVSVYRPNHALAHGLRQGFLAADIVDSIYKNKSTNFCSEDGIKLKKWIDRKMVKDPYFKQKIEFVSAFQRTGRQSEVSGTKNPVKYNSYERADAKNFEKEVKPYVSAGNLFHDEKEVRVYKEAILWSTANEGMIDPSKNENLYFLRKIFHAAHDLDLRRMKKFDPERVKCSTVEELFGACTVDQAIWKVNPKYTAEKNAVDALWARSKQYLDATGDRDVVTQQDYSPKFCELAHNPHRMATVMHETRIKSTIKF
jgi:SidE phosphodiesterase (PDE) domain